MRMPTETTSFAGAATPIRPMPTTEDLSRSIQSLDHTLSEVLVLLYHVVQANQRVIEALGRHQPLTAPSTRVPDLRPLLQTVIGERMSQGQ